MFLHPRRRSPMHFSSKGNEDNEFTLVLFNFSLQGLTLKNAKIVIATISRNLALTVIYRLLQNYVDEAPTTIWNIDAIQAVQ